MQNEQIFQGQVAYLQQAQGGGLALALYDALNSPSHATDPVRTLLQLAAAYLAASSQSGTKRPERAGRDAILAAPIDGLHAEEQCLLASVVAFQREGPRERRELTFLRLNDNDRALALYLAAILALADALLPVGTPQATDLVLLCTPERQTTIIVGAALDEATVASASRRWRDLIGEVVVRSAEPSELQALQTTLALAGRPVAEPPPVEVAFELVHRLNGEESLAEGARRLLRRQFEKMLAREDDVRSGEDPEDIHQMRVATRRLRASLQIVEPFFARKKIAWFRGELRQTAAALGAVRDRDVFLIDLRAHDSALPNGAALDRLVAAVEEERATARLKLLDELDSQGYSRFKRRFARFLTTPGAAAEADSPTGMPLRLRDAVGSMLWQRYEQWRAFEVVVPGGDDEQIHEARIAGKRLRYTIEFFADALGPRSEETLKPLAALQENLGQLQDIVVAHEHVNTLGMQDDPGAVAYLAARDAEHATLLAQLPAVWEKVDSATYRRRLYELIIRL